MVFGLVAWALLGFLGWLLGGCHVCLLYNDINMVCMSITSLVCVRVLVCALFIPVG